MENKPFFTVIFCGIAPASVLRCYHTQDLLCRKSTLQRQLQINTIPPTQQLSKLWTITWNSGLRAAFDLVLGPLVPWRWWRISDAFEDGIWQGSCSATTEQNKILSLNTGRRGPHSKGFARGQPHLWGGTSSIPVATTHMVFWGGGGESLWGEIQFQLSSCPTEVSQRKDEIWNSEFRAGWYFFGEKKPFTE